MAKKKFEKLKEDFDKELSEIKLNVELLETLSAYKKLDTKILESALSVTVNVRECMQRLVVDAMDNTNKGE